MKKVDNNVLLNDIVQDMCNLKEDFQQYMVLSKQKAIMQDSIINIKSEMIDLYKKQNNHLRIASICFGLSVIISLLILIAHT